MKNRERIEILIYGLTLGFCLVWLVTAASFYVSRLLQEASEKGVETAAGTPQRCGYQAPCVVTLENGATVVIP